MATALSELPRFLVLEPLSTIRVEMRLASSACEIDVKLDNPAPTRSFVLLIGHKDGPFVQRVRLAGKARIYFDPQSPGDYVLLFANPQKEPIVLRLKVRDVGPEENLASPRPRGTRSRAPAPRARHGSARPRGSARPQRPPAPRRH